jgi:hypothetical protein
VDETKMNEYKSWCKWHPLKTVMLGRSYYPEYFRDVKNSKIQDCLIRIAEETEEDLLYFKGILQSFGCHVIRPKLDIKDNIMDFINDKGQTQQLSRPPLQPRDAQLVIGDKLVYISKDHPAIMERLKEYSSEYVNLYKDNIPTITNEFRADGIGRSTQQENEKRKWKEAKLAPCITTVNKDVYIDIKEIPSRASFQENFPELRFHTISIGGHSDGAFHTVGNGKIISIRNIMKYSETFPGWDVCYVKQNSKSYMRRFWDKKNQIRRGWWLPGEEDNDSFSDFVECWLKDWVGHAQETYVDVNVLVLDEKHVCVPKYNKDIFEFFAKHDIEPIIVPFRHRCFWDGGLHCMTLDLYRDGVCIDLFPDRTGPIHFKTKMRKRIE